nr:protein FAM163A isoform X2 [Pan paniscus]
MLQPSHLASFVALAFEHAAPSAWNTLPPALVWMTCAPHRPQLNLASSKKHPLTSCPPVSFSLLKLEAPEVGPHTSLCCLHRPVLSSLPPAQELLFYHWPGLKFEVLTGTDALGHDVPPTAVCSGVARVTESLLLQLFHESRCGWLTRCLKVSAGVVNSSQRSTGEGSTSSLNHT